MIFYFNRRIFVKWLNECIIIDIIIFNINSGTIYFNIKHNFNSVNENELKIVCNDDFEDANSLFASCIHITEFDFSN